MTFAAPIVASHQDLAALVAKYDGRAPRYTSYPTALQFTPSVGEATYRAWLANLPADAPVSLYLHIPYCQRLCWYCGCNTRAVTRAEPLAGYLDVLLREIELLSEALPSRMIASAVHLGGGTPNMLTSAQLDRLFTALGEAFAMTADRELATELDPAVLTPAWVEAAAAHGLSRASLGVQNLDPAVQTAVNRRDTLEQVAACFAWLRAAGVRSINVDLMYGLPHQTVANTLATVDAMVALAPERIALFGYAHVPWMKAHQRLLDETALPGPAERIDQSESAAERLVAEGYVRVGLDHFARPEDSLATASAEGRLRRNFQGYTTDAAQTLLGIGASAIGRLPQGYVQNAAQEIAWRAAVGTDRLGVAKGVALTDEDRFRAEIIERLMCDLSVDLAAVCARHGRELRDVADARASLAPFIADGLARFQDDVLEVLGPGRLVVRSICAAFDPYFDASGARHSKAI